MVAYSFKKQFVDPIQSGAKRQTIRADRRRHVRSGETIQIYTAMRTKQCRLVGTAICICVDPITINVQGSCITLKDRVLQPLVDLNDFARSDGFEDWPAMRRFWEANHPDQPVFSGVLIRWDQFTPQTQDQ